MILGNIGCGGTRLPEPWLNIDDLYNHFPVGHPERDLLKGRLDLESNYVNMDISQPWWPTTDPNETMNWFDGFVLSHVLEHFDAPGALHILQECYRALKEDGCVRISVPDASYFRSVFDRDTRDNWVELFEDASDSSESTRYFDVALWFYQHRQLYTQDVVWCQLIKAGFSEQNIHFVAPNTSTREGASTQLATLDNRIKFSIFAEAYK